MVVRNGIEKRVVTSMDFDLTSISFNRVLLPCHAWEELRLEIMNAAYGILTKQELHKVQDAWYEDIIVNENVSMLFNIQRKSVRLTAYTSCDVVFGKHLNSRIPVVADKKEITSILDEFFLFGGRGLNSEYADYYGKVYAEWKSKK